MLWCTLQSLRRLIAHVINEGSLHSGFHDVYFLEEIMPKLRKQGKLPHKMGHMIAYGNEAIVFSLGHDKVVRIQPTYDLDPDNANKVYERLKSAPNGGLYAVRTDARKIDGFDQGEMVTLAVYSVLERLTPLTSHEQQMIDNAIKTRDPQVPDQRLQAFLEQYLNMNIDISSENVMKRDGAYVIVDPE